MSVESSKPITATGIGRPDYTGEQWQSKGIPKFELHYGETIKSFSICGSAIASPYPYIVAPILAGVVTPLIDTDTGLPNPFTVPAGYELEILQVFGAPNQNLKSYTYVDGFFMQHWYNDGFDAKFFQNIVGFSTKYIDPTFALPHTILLQVENIGLGNMEGLIEVDWILRVHSTEIPRVKQIRCKYCGDIITVPNETTRNNCSKCGKLNLYFTMPRYIIPKEVK